MAAQARVFQQVDALGTLKELAELIRDPNSITKAHEIARSEMALTVEQQEKYEKAIEFMANYDSAISSLESQKNMLLEAQEGLAKKIDDFDTYRQKEMEVIEQKKQELTTNSADIEEAKNKVEKSLRDFNEKQTAFSDAYEKTLTDIRNKAAENEKNRAANENEKSRLSALQIEMKSKAEKLREQAAEL